MSAPQRSDVPESNSKITCVPSTSVAHTGDDCDYRQLCDFLLDNSPSRSSDEDLPLIPMNKTWSMPTPTAAYNHLTTINTAGTPSGKSHGIESNGTYNRLSTLKGTQQYVSPSISGPQHIPVTSSEVVWSSSLPCSTGSSCCLQIAPKSTLDIHKRTLLQSIPRPPLDTVPEKTPLNPIPTRIPVPTRVPLEPIHPISNVYPSSSVHLKPSLKKLSDDQKYSCQMLPEIMETPNYVIPTAKQTSFHDSIPCSQRSDQHCDRYDKLFSCVCD